MSQAELLKLVLDVLSTLEMGAMLVGSHVSSFYGEPRSTHDVDLVIDLDPTKIDRLVASFSPDRYYLSRVALQEGRMANIIDTMTGDKVDLFLLSDDRDARVAFERRRPGVALGIDLHMQSPEDAIISKLRWDRQVGGSDQQIRDILGILRGQNETLEVGLIDQWARTHGYEPEWTELKSKVQA